MVDRLTIQSLDGKISLDLGKSTGKGWLRRQTECFVDPWGADYGMDFDLNNDRITVSKQNVIMHKQFEFKKDKTLMSPDLVAMLKKDAISLPFADAAEKLAGQLEAEQFMIAPSAKPYKPEVDSSGLTRRTGWRDQT